MGQHAFMVRPPASAQKLRRFRGRPLPALAASLLGLVLSGCAAEGESAAAGDGVPDAGADTQGPDAGVSDALDDVSPPPEEEERFDLQPPRASRSYVFVANRTLNSVARIDSRTLSVTPIEVCLEPTEVRTRPDRDRAVVLCRGDDQLAVIDSEGGADEVALTWVAERANALRLSPNGDFALVWYDDGAAEPGEPPGNLQDLTVVDLRAEPASYLLTVGFDIRSIAFDASGEVAFVTTEDGLSRVDMNAVDGDAFVPVLSLGEDPLARAADREVLVTDDGSLAFVRSSTFAGLRVLDTSTGQLSDIMLPTVPTDLDLLPGGDRGLAVLRDLSMVALIPLPEAVSNPETIELIEVPDQTIGLARVVGPGPAGDLALLYSTVVASSRLVVLDLASAQYTVYELRKPITGVFVAPLDQRILVFHGKSPGEPIVGEPWEDFVAKSWGYTLFDLPSGFGRLVLSPTEPDDVAFTDDGARALVMLEDAARDVRAVQRVDFGTFRVDTLEMSRPPEAIGIVPATGRGYVSQVAETGRITFIDVETGEQQHVTAYQLNRRIE